MIEKEKHVEGSPWTTHRRFSTYEEASDYRNDLLVETDNLQVKVRWSRNRDDFIVKTRVDPEIVAKEKATKKKGRKKSRKR